MSRDSRPTQDRAQDRAENRAEFRTEDDGAPAPPDPGEPVPTIIGHRLDLEPLLDAESTQRLSRPPPMRQQRGGNRRRNVLAAAVLLGAAAGIVLTLAPPRGMLGWLQGKLGRSTADQEASERVSGTGGSPLPETRSLVPAPTAPVPEADDQADDDEPRPAAARKAAPSAMSRAKARAVGKARKTSSRKRAARARARLPDDSVEVELF